jgi:hypothetical protein
VTAKVGEAGEGAHESFPSRGPRQPLQRPSAGTRAVQAQERPFRRQRRASGSLAAQACVLLRSLQRIRHEGSPGTTRYSPKTKTPGRGQRFLELTQGSRSSGSVWATN